MFQKKTVRQLIEKVAPLLCHPGIGIRYGVIAFISAGVNPRNRLFSQFDYQVLLLPLLRPYLTRDLVELTETSLLGSLTFFFSFAIHISLRSFTPSLLPVESLQEPLGRAIFNQALVWAKRRINTKEKAKDEETARPRSNTLTGKIGKDEPVSLHSQSLVVETEDEFFSQQLKKLGIPSEVEKKLLNLKAFIFKNPGSHSRNLGQPDQKPQPPY